MIWKTVRLDLSAKQIQALKAQNAKILKHLEEGRPLRLSVLENLKKEMSRSFGIAGTEGMAAILAQIASSGDHIAVQLLHSDNEILNLPWAMAEAPQTGQPLGDLPQLYLTKCLAAQATKQEIAPLDRHPTGPPLKILIMISSPKDADHENRLSYEQEELQILTAFQPLMQTGRVEIDFTDDGSLKALESKLKSNRYHILHFSGHSLFKDGKGYLQLENPLTLRTELASGEAFAHSVNCHPDYRIPFVMLCSCQSAQGHAESRSFGKGITNRLLKIGVPAVISMGMSIRDRYAAFFSAQFYGQMAEKHNVPFAFKSAVAQLRKQEHDDLVQARSKQPVPLQWIIPNLYMAGRLEHLIDWQAPQEALRFSSYRFITEKNRLLLRHEKNYVFIGRREEKAKILAPLFDRTPVLLKGQGGVGKTALAEYCVQRLIAANPRTRPFLFNETIRTLQDIIDTLQNDLFEQGQTHVAAGLARFEKGLEKLHYLVFEAAKVCQPVFVFDNLETFQSAPGERFAEKYRDIEQAIVLLCTMRKFAAILTCRYPLADMPNVQSFDLNQVGLTDFWKKCHELEISRLQTELLQSERKKQRTAMLAKPPVQFIDIVELLHSTFGGNYRALEFFDALFRQAPQKLIPTFGMDSLKKFQAEMAQHTGQVVEQMRSNLVLTQLMGMLEDQPRSLLHLICRFRIPVQEFALRLQRQDSDATPPDNLTAILQKLNDLTLIEISLDRQTLQAYYYATPIVRDMLAEAQAGVQALPFSPQQAGVYHYHIYQNIDASLTELDEAFFHFDAAQAKDRLQEIGETLSRFYYDYSLYQNAFFYAGRVHEVLGEQTEARLLNRLGLILDLFGKFDNALAFYTSAFNKYKEAGDKSGEGTTLNNMATTAHARGDYQTALDYLQQSWKISRDIGDKSGQIPTLHNMAMIAYKKEDYRKSFEYETAAYQLALETGDAMGLYEVGQFYGQLLYSIGQKEEGIAVLKKSYQIGEQSGLPGVENIAKILQHLGGT